VPVWGEWGGQGQQQKGAQAFAGRASLRKLARGCLSEEGFLPLLARGGERRRPPFSCRAGAELAPSRGGRVRGAELQLAGPRGGPTLSHVSLCPYPFGKAEEKFEGSNCICSQRIYPSQGTLLALPSGLHGVIGSVQARMESVLKCPSGIRELAGAPGSEAAVLLRRLTGARASS